MDSPLNPGPPDDWRAGAFGTFLRQARERRGLTIEEIAQETKIPWRHLDALEHGNFAVVPRGIYRRAEIRAFAQTVGLDQSLALAELDRALQASAPTEAQTAVRARSQRPRARPGVRASRRSLMVLAALTMAAIVGLAVRNPWSSVPEHAQVGPIPATSAPLAATAPAANALAPIVAPEPLPISEVEGQLVVITDPKGARVTVNGVGWGVTPITIRHLPLGDQRVRVTKDGYASEEHFVQLAEERPEGTVQITLRTKP